MSNYKLPSPLLTEKEIVDFCKKNSVFSVVLNEDEEIEEEDRIKEDNQTQKEELLLKNITICQESTINRYKQILNVIDVSHLSKLLKEDYFNVYVMQVVSCLIATLNQYSQSVYIKDANIRYWLNNLNLLASSGNSYVIQSGFFSSKNNSNNDLFIIKSPRIDKPIIHELFIGLMAMNKLRAQIPNFLYTFGILNCSPVIVNDKKILSWCNPSEKNIYNIVYEKIIGQSFFDILKSMSLDDFLNYYLQILFSLQLANKEFQFTHNDLHAENVILRDAKYTQFYIPYSISETETMYLKTDKVATIIDFGMAHIKFNDDDYGPYNYTYFNYNTNFPIGDAYHFLIACLKNMKLKNNSVYKELDVLLNFFVQPKDLDRFLDRCFFDISYLPFMRDIKLTSLIKYIKETYPLVNQFLTPKIRKPVFTKSIPVMLCSNDCLGIEDIEKSLNIDNNAKVNSLFSLYNLIIIGYKPEVKNMEQIINSEIKRLNDSHKSLIKMKMNNGDNYLQFLLNKSNQYLANNNIRLFYSLENNQWQLQDVYQLLNNAITKWAVIVKTSKYIGYNIEANFFNWYEEYRQLFNSILDNFTKINRLNVVNSLERLPSFVDLENLEKNNEI